MNSTVEDKIRPVDPERFHLALSVYQAALAAERANAKPGAPSSNADDTPAIGILLANLAGKRAMLAVQKEFPDAEEFQNLSIRLQHFFDILGDRKLIKRGMVRHRDDGVELDDAVINALASAPFRKSGALDRMAFHALVKTERRKLEADGNG